MKISPLVSLGHENSMKDLIILTLSQEWPLTVRKIHNAIEKSRASVTYHAVHKAVRQLVKQGVLKKERNGYLISIEWIEQMSGLVEGMKNNYLYNKPLYLPGLKEFKQEGDTQIFTFENLAEADSYRKRLQWEYLSSKAAKPPYCGMSMYARSPVVYTEKSLDLLKAATGGKTPVYLLYAGNTAVDRWAADYYRNEYTFVKTGVDLAKDCETMIMGDVVTQIYVPQKIMKYLQGLYSRVKDVNEVNVQEFYRQVYLTKADVKFVVIRNPEIAKQLREQVLSHFRRDKISVFDIDGLLVHRSYMPDFASFLEAKGLFGKEQAAEIRRLAAQLEAKKIKYDAYVKGFKKAYLAGIKGKKFSEIAAASREFVSARHDENFAFSIKLFKLVRSYRKVLAITRLPKEAVIGLQALFPWDELISSEIKVKDDVMTGELCRDLTSEGKFSETKRWLDSGVDLKGSIGFGDTHRDLPFLARVEIPIAISPDEKLKAIARKRGWLIFNGNEGADAFMAKLHSMLNGA
jgi:phosphoserine phosphatase